MVQVRFRRGSIGTVARCQIEVLVRRGPIRREATGAPGRASGRMAPRDLGLRAGRATVSRRAVRVRLGLRAGRAMVSRRAVRVPLVLVRR